MNASSNGNNSNNDGDHMVWISAVTDCVAQWNALQLNRKLELVE